MPSIRLTKDQKAVLREHSYSETIPEMDGMIDPNDGLEFHEGVVAGMFLALRIIGNQDDGRITSASRIIAICVSRYLQETLNR